MKCAKWEQCSEVSIRSEISNLQEVEMNLGDLRVLHGKDSTTDSVILALSFVHQAIEQLLQIGPQA